MGMFGLGSKDKPAKTSPQTPLADAVLKVRTEFAVKKEVGAENARNLAHEVRNAMGISGPENVMLMDTLVRGAGILKLEEDSSRAAPTHGWKALVVSVYSDSPIC